MNIYDIAGLCGVSIATVSRVVNDSPLVSEKTKERVTRLLSVHFMKRSRKKLRGRTSAPAGKFIFCPLENPGQCDILSGRRRLRAQSLKKRHFKTAIHADYHKYHKE